MHLMKHGILSLATAVSLMAAGSAWAVNLQQLASAADQIAAGGTSGAASTHNVASLTSLLNGGSKTLSSGTMNNATGVLQYCVKQKLVNATSADNIKSKLMNKLGLEGNNTQKQDYQQGLSGLLNTKDGQQLNLNTLSDTPLGQKVKSKACDVILKQGVNFLS